MRTLLLATAALSSLIASHEAAEACGGYNHRPEPTVFRLSSHTGRTFVLRPGEKVPTKGLDWKQISPTSFDMTQVAPALDFFEPKTFTLVGASGTKVISTRKRAFLSRTFEFQHAVGAVEVDADGGFSIALSGSHPGATWSEMVELASSKAAAKWITAHGVTPSDVNSIYVSRVKGTDIETLSLFPKDGQKVITFVKQGNTDLGRFEGWPTGTFTVDGITKLVMVDGANVVTAYLN